jgi:dipeptidyl aminopeptidase/acylaminoacyl peptidase
MPHSHAAYFLGSILMMANAAGFASDRWTPELMLQVQRVGSVQVSPDGERVAFTARYAVVDDSTSEFRTHIHLADAGGTHARQLTRGDKSCDDPQWSPDGKWIAFISARSGKRNLWLIDPGGGEAQPLTDVKTEVSSLKWSPDGRFLAFTALDAATPDEEARKKAKNDARVVDRDIKRHRLYVIPVDTPPDVQREPRLLTPGEVNVGGDLFKSGRPPFDWSPDGSTIVFTQTRSPQANDWTTASLSRLDVQSGQITPLVATGASESAACFSPDGTQIAFVISDDPPTWAGRRRLAVLPIAGGETKLLPETADGFGRYSELVGWSADGRRLYFTEMHGVNMAVMALPLDGAPVEQINSRELSTGMSQSGVSLNARRSHFGFSWETLSSPPEAAVAQIDSWRPKTVSRIHGSMSFPAAPRTEVIRWKSKDDVEVEGLLTYPHGYAQGTRYPLLLVIHGGPMGVFTQTFDGTPASYPVAAFAEEGYAVLRANVRGSSGYGAKFRYANYEDWGGGDYHDLMTGVDHLIELGIADAERLGVMGWSYGGFLTSWTITHTQRFRAASVGAGVTNLVSFTGTADIPGFLPDYFHGEFWDDLEPYRNHSPMLHVKGVRTPTLIQHGEKDERVPLSQGEELYNALKRQGCQTEMVIYPRTPHGIEEPALLLDCMRRNLGWFARFLE